MKRKSNSVDDHLSHSLNYLNLHATTNSTIDEILLRKRIRLLNIETCNPVNNVQTIDDVKTLVIQDNSSMDDMEMDDIPLEDSTLAIDLNIPRPELTNSSPMDLYHKTLFKYQYDPAVTQLVLYQPIISQQQQQDIQKDIQKDIQNHESCTTSMEMT